MQLYTVYFWKKCSTCFGWYLHPSSGTHTTVSTASGTCKTVTVTCRYCGRVWTGLSVWEMYWTVLVRLRQQPHQNRSIHFPHHTQTCSNSSTTAAGNSNGLTSARCCRHSCVCSWWWVEYHPKYVELFPEINKLCSVASCWIYRV